MFSKIKKIYRNKSGVNDLALNIEAIQNNLVALHRKSDELYWGMIFNNAISNSEWLFNTSFTPGRWAAGYPMLYVLYRVYNEIKPLYTLELGLGESTKLLYQYQKSVSESRFWVVEQDVAWLDFFARKAFDVRKNTIILEIEQEKIDDISVNRYKNFFSAIEKLKYHLVVIDGPKGSTQFSRYEIVQLVENDMLADDFIIIMDDFERPGEKQTIEKLKQVLAKKNKKFVTRVYSGMKETCVICAAKFSFLTSL